VLNKIYGKIVTQKKTIYEPWPEEIRVNRGGKILKVLFDNGEEYVISSELLRVESPSAEVQGHGLGEKITVPGKSQVLILGVEQVGNYAIRIRFDDLHDTGIYSWRYLYQVGTDQKKLTEKYLARLAMEGLSRHP